MFQIGALLFQTTPIQGLSKSQAKNWKQSAFKNAPNNTKTRRIIILRVFTF